MTTRRCCECGKPLATHTLDELKCCDDQRDRRVRDEIRGLFAQVERQQLESRLTR